MNIVLIGYRGTGKSTVASILANRLGRELIGTDALIVKRAGKRIPEIVKSGGWELFRKLESEVISEVAKKDGIIVDAGGGVILKEENTRNLKNNGWICLLTADVETMVSRISTDTERPSLTGGKTFVEEIEEVLKEREPLYRAAADFQIDTTRITPQEVTERITAQLEKQKPG